MEKRESTISLEEALAGEYRRAYVSAEPIDRNDAEAVKRSQELTFKTGPDVGLAPFRDLAIRVAKDFDFTGIATVEFEDKDNDLEYVWDVRTNAWTYRFSWSTYTRSATITASGVWDPRVEGSAQP